MSTTKRPNILFVFADQMRGMDMGCAGNADVRTPVLDALARQGTHYPHAYANCPVCTPSRGTILTGRYPLRHGAVANDVPLATDEASIATVLAGQGYRTGYVGKWHLDGVPRDRFTPPGPRRQGFEFWAVWNCAHNYFHGKVFRDDDEPVELDGYEPVGQTDLALEFLASDDERPWCLFVSYGTPHAPYDQAPEEYRAMYDPERITPPATFGEPQPEGFRPLGGEPSRRALCDYYAHITALDEQLGRLLEAVDRAGQADDTLVVFTSDHGDMLWSHGMVKKEQPWEEAVRIPLLVRWPGVIPADRRASNLVSTMDYAPTMLSLVGAPVPECVHGRDLSPIWRGAGGPSGAMESVLLTEPIIVDQGAAQGIGEWRGLRTRRYTYARWLDGTPWLLYDNTRDPHQRENLVGDAASAVALGTLDRMLDARLAAVGDPCLPWDETIRTLGLVELWNERERNMHPKAPRLVE